MKNRFISNAKVSLFTSLLISSLGIITGVLAARILGPESRGNYGEVIFWSGIISMIFSFSLHEKIVVEKGASIENNLFIFSFIQMIFTMPFIIFLVYFWLGEVGIDKSLISIYYVLFSFFSLYSMNAMGYLQKKGYFFYFNVCRALIPISYLLSVVSLYLLFGSKGEPIIIFVVCNLICNFLLFLFLYHKVEKNSNRSNLFDSLNSFLNVVKNNVNIHLIFVVIFLSSQIDKFIIVSFYSSSFVGLYLVSTALILAVFNILLNTAHTVLVPLMKEDEVERIPIMKLILISLCLSLLISAFIILICGKLIIIVYGDEYSYASTIATYYALAYIPYSVKILLSKAYRLSLSQVVMFKLEIISLLPILLLSFVSVITMEYEYLILGVFTSGVTYLLGFIYVISKKNKNILST